MAVPATYARSPDPLPPILLRLVYLVLLYHLVTDIICAKGRGPDGGPCGGVCLCCPYSFGRLRLRSSTGFGRPHALPRRRRIAFFGFCSVRHCCCLCFLRTQQVTLAMLCMGAGEAYVAISPCRSRGMPAVEIGGSYTANRSRHHETCSATSPALSCQLVGGLILQKTAGQLGRVDPPDDRLRHYCGGVLALPQPGARLGRQRGAGKRVQERLSATLRRGGLPHFEGEKTKTGDWPFVAPALSLCPGPLKNQIHPARLQNWPMPGRDPGGDPLLSADAKFPRANVTQLKGGVGLPHETGR